MNLEGYDPYPSTELIVHPRYEGEDALVPGVSVRVENMSNGAAYSAVSDSLGEARVRLTPGRYRVAATVERVKTYPSGAVRKTIWNGSKDNLRFTATATLEMELTTAAPSPLIIKEIYSGGCKKTPLEGDYQSDKYMIIHNNSDEDQYLDSLCVGCVAPYNSTGNSHWVKPGDDGTLIYSDYAPIIQAVWQFPGSGSDFVLHPGEDAVLCFCGAIDHTRQFPLSVNLDKEDYFVCYDNQAFPNTMYHPAPGTNIRPERYMTMVIKLGVANAYTVSVNSPALVLFRARGMSIQQLIENDYNITTVPGSSNDRIVKLPWSWVEDGVEVFTAASNNIKRLHPKVDVGYVTFSQSFLGHTLFRKVNEEETASAGYEVLWDTNNSSSDFYEREVQSLHE